MGVSGSGFEKKRSCPASQVLIYYHQRRLPTEQTSRVAAHLAACEFCAAELQLLLRFPSTSEVCESPEMPDSLRALAMALLRKDDSAMGTRVG